MGISGSDWLEVPTIYEAYFLGLCKGICPQNVAKHMVQYLHIRILKFPLVSLLMKIIGRNWENMAVIGATWENMRKTCFPNMPTPGNMSLVLKHDYWTNFFYFTSPYLLKWCIFSPSPSPWARSGDHMVIMGISLTQSALMSLGWNLKRQSAKHFSPPLICFCMSKVGWFGSTLW